MCIQFIAQRILDINENKTYVDPKTLLDDPLKKKAQDEEIFQRTRLVNCGFFMHIILGGMFVFGIMCPTSARKGP